MEKPNFKNINYQWKSKEELGKEFLAKGWIETKDRWISPQELRESGVVIKNGRILIPTETKNDGKREIRVISQKYLDFIKCGDRCHKKYFETNNQDNIEKYPEI